MTKVVCAYADCKYNSDTHVCKCKTLNLSEWNVATVNMGRKEFWECKQYEKSEDAKALEDMFKDLMENASS